MSLRKLPEIKVPNRPQAFQWDAPADAISRWSDLPLAAEADQANTISIYEMIGEDFWSGGGFTAKKAAGILRSIGSKAVTVNINSPGGDMFEGLAIYNLLREHPGAVSVKVMGLAASAASVIAMSGDTISMGLGTTMMIHKAWGLVVGNEYDFDDATEVFRKFDRSMAEVYSARTGIAEVEILDMLGGPGRASDGTWMTAKEAVDKGFADSTFEASDDAPPARATVPEHILARRQAEAALAARYGRKDRYDILSKLISGERDAARPAARDAGDLRAVADSIRRLQATLTA